VTSAAMATELTFIMIKPDGVQRGLVRLYFLPFFFFFFLLSLFSSTFLLEAFGHTVT
jgi:hypothetical protein